MNAVTALASDDDLIAQARIAYFNLNDDTARQPANSSRYLWVVDFPMFDGVDEAGNPVANGVVVM